MSVKIKALHTTLIGFTILLLVGIYILRMLRITGEPGFPLDDSWIHFQFARNLIMGKGFSYNSGIPINGSTSPIWTLLLAGTWWIFRDYFVAAIFLGIFFSFLTCIFAYKIAGTIEKGKSFPLIVGILVAATPPLAWSSLSGMEPPLYSFLALLGIYYHLIYRWEGGWRQYISTIGFALAGMARPECMILFPLALTDNFILWKLHQEGEGRALLRKILLHILVFLIIMVPYLFFNYSLSRSIVPTSFSAKVGGQGISGLLLQGNIKSLKVISYYLLHNLHELIRSCVESNFLLSLFLIIGFFELLFGSLKKTFSHHSLIVLLILIFQPLAMAVVAPYEGILFQNQRYTTHLMPLLVITQAYGVYRMPHFLKRLITFYNLKNYFKNAVKYLMPVTLSLIFLISLNVHFVDLRGKKPLSRSLSYAYNVKNINDMQVNIGKWVNKNTPVNAVLAVNDVGAIAFFGRRMIIDTMGLITPELIPYLRKGPTRQEGLLEYLEQKRPSYLIIFPNWYPKLANRRDLIEEVYSVKLRDNITSGGDEMVVYKTIW